MRGLAEYAMSGRFQAATVAVLFGLVPGFSLISAGIVALVVLRRGWQDGIQTLLWALLPAGLQWKLGDPGSVMMLGGVMLASLALRHWRSWQATALVVTVCAVLMQLSLPLQQNYLARVGEAVKTLEASGFAIQMVVDGAVVTASGDQLLDALLKFYGVYQLLLMTISVLLGRYWQARLYNPGGFREEFHNLRFDRSVMLVLLVLIGLGLYGQPPFSDWLMMFCLIPVLNALAVVHSLVAKWQMGTMWLFAAYLLLLIAAPAFVLLGFADNAADIRKRLQRGTND